MSQEAFPKVCRTFKKYTSECMPGLLAAVREWAGRKCGLHEDASIVKVTGTGEQISELDALVKDRFPQYSGGITDEKAEKPAKTA